MLLIAGGLLDPSLQALADAATRLGLPWCDGRVQAGVSPPFHWDLSSACGQSGDRTPTPGAAPAKARRAAPGEPPDDSALAKAAASATERGAHHSSPWGAAIPCAAFIRQDVFAALADPRPEVSQRALGWFTAVQGWLLAHPGVRCFNADISAVAYNKPAALLQARACGLRIPPTWVSNDTARLRTRLAAPAIAKPVAGGGLCQTLGEALQGVEANYSAMPALIQPRLVAPELRVFIIGTEAFAFEVRSPSLDYRAQQDAELAEVPVPPETAALRTLMQALRMDFGAADFKTDPDTGELVFLELNTSPMFSRFDEVSGGKLCECMVQQLLTRPAPGSLRG